MMKLKYRTLLKLLLLTPLLLSIGCAEDKFKASDNSFLAGDPPSKGGGEAGEDTDEGNQGSGLQALIDHYVGLGAPARATELALTYYTENADDFDNQRYVTVIDMSLHSGNKRWFLLDLATNTMDSYVVAHGKGSDANHDGYAEKFSNVNQSKMTSLGFYQASETYYGKYGLSLKLDGLSRTNSNARARYIVVHGAGYVNEGASKQGRSWGCPALDKNLSSGVINKIKNGSVFFIYDPQFESEL